MSPTLHWILESEQGITLKEEGLILPKGMWITITTIWEK
jgi:hypothetical protein